VMAMFSTKPLSETTTRALASVADGVALGIHRKQIEGRLREREQLFMQFANNMQDVLWLSRPHAQQTLWISPAVEQVMGVKPEDVYENPYAFMEVIIPEDRPRMAQFMEMTETLRADSPKKTTDVEYRIRKDGELRWLWTRAFPSFDGEGKIYQICGFTHDITEKKEAERRVSEFYSTVSHELRTPLTSIRAALGLIEGGVTHPDSTETVELISIARREADRLIRLINDILDMRKMEAGKLPLKILPLAPHVVVSNTVSAMRTFAQEHDVELVTWIQEERSFIGDYDRVVQVLTNLISNAIKFSPAGSLVNVNVQASFSERIRFAVSDEGPGIPPEQYNKLFGIFQQLDQSDSRSRGGTGLGLAISKAIVERLNGVIGFDSELGKGSTFWFELPFLAESWSPAEEPAGGSTADKHSPALLEFIQEYGKTLPKRLLSLEKCIRDAKVSERPIAVKDCLNEVRKIRASSEPCGFPEVAAAMAKLEQSLTSIINKEGDPEQEWKEILLCCARITEVSKSQYAQDR
jgi:PAS domain S-box-containing protein